MTIRSTRSSLGWIFLLSLVVFLPAAWGQPFHDEPGGGFNRDFGRDHAGPGRKRFANKGGDQHQALAATLARLDLTEEQKAKFRALKSSMKEGGGSAQQVKKINRELGELVLNGASEADFNAKLAELSAAYKALYNKAAEFRNILTPEQLKKFEELRHEEEIRLDERRKVMAEFYRERFQGRQGSFKGGRGSPQRRHFDRPRGGMRGGPEGGLTDF